jgi:hypothetical protein
MKQSAPSPSIVLHLLFEDLFDQPVALGEDATRGAQAEKIARREQAEAQSGQKTRGRKPKLPEEVVDADAKANVTGPESRIMKTRSGYARGFSGQALVTEQPFIIAGEGREERRGSGMRGQPLPRTHFVRLGPLP